MHEDIETELSETATRFAEQMTPPSAADVRTRGDRLHRRNAIGTASLALVLASVVGIPAVVVTAGSGRQDPANTVITTVTTDPTTGPTTPAPVIATTPPPVSSQSTSAANTPVSPTSAATLMDIPASAWLTIPELPYAASIPWANDQIGLAHEPASAGILVALGGCHGMPNLYTGTDVTVTDVGWDFPAPGQRGFGEKIVVETIVAFPSKADASQVIADAKAGAVASKCASVAAMNAMTTTVFGTAVNTPDGVSFAETYAEDGRQLGSRGYLHFYVVRKGSLVAEIELIGDSSATNDTSHDAAVLSAMAARLP